MLSSDGGRYQGSASNAYSPNIARPGKRSPLVRRAALKIALCVLLPPIGLVYIWRTRSFQPRGRMLMSVLSFLTMLLMLLPTMKSAPLATTRPLNPMPPQSATRVPESDVATALSSIEQTLIAEEAAEATRIGEDEMAPSPGEDAAQVAANEAEIAREEHLNTIVYAVNRGAKLYHAGPTCDGQTNRRSLTLREATIVEGLGACKTCNPPVP